MNQDSWAIVITVVFVLALWLLGRGSPTFFGTDSEMDETIKDLAQDGKL